MTHHTQDPWFSEEHVNGKTYVYPKSGLNPICEIFEGYKQNQDLIASAPELLAELELKLSWIVDNVPKTVTGYESELNELKRIIKKAKGE
jgi:hypothetical protein